MLRFVKKAFFTCLTYEMSSIFGTGRSMNSMAWKLAKWAKFVLVLTNTHMLKKSRILSKLNCCVKYPISFLCFRCVQCCYKYRPILQHEVWVTLGALSISFGVGATSIWSCAPKIVDSAPKILAVRLQIWAATKLFGTSHRIGWESDIQTMVTMNRNPKTIELRANKIQWN